MIEPEPPAPERGQRFEEATPPWTARLDHIVHRADVYLAAYRDNPEYDFDQTGGMLGAYEKAVALAFRQYAEGSMTAGGVAYQVRLLRGAYKKENAQK